jgi:hypothetical protein
MAGFRQQSGTSLTFQSQARGGSSVLNLMRNRLGAIACIGHYVFHGKPNQVETLRAALEQARNEIKEKPNNGLVATAERAVRMTDDQHWSLVFSKVLMVHLSLSLRPQSKSAHPHSTRGPRRRS